MKTVSLEQEINPWEAQSARFNFAAQKLNLDEGLWKVLQYPNRELIVHIPVSMDNGKLEVFTGFRVQHSIARGPAKGGILRRSQGRRYLRSPQDVYGRTGTHDPSLHCRAH